MLAVQMSLRAWKWLAVVLGMVGTWASVATAGTWLPVSDDGGGTPADMGVPRGASVVANPYNDGGLRVTVEVAGLELAFEKTAGGEFVAVSWPEAPRMGGVGEPALPVVRRLFAAPQGSSVDLTVTEGSTSMIDLEAVGFVGPLLPVQSLAQPADAVAEPAPFAWAAAAYAKDAFCAAQRVEVTPAGVFRGWQLHLLEVRPVAYNPARATLTVWPRIEVEVSFGAGHAPDGDLGSLASLKGVLLNPLPLERNGRGSGNLLIVTAEDFSGSAPLTQFATAKVSQGFDVATHTVTAGTHRNSIKAYLQSLWGTPDAPDYILLVGDANDHWAYAESGTIPIWIGLGSKSAATDLYYACMDAGDDWFPDVAIGRWAVDTVDELQTVVDKTLYVETGVFDDPSFAERAVFMAGTDPQPNADALHDWIIDTYMAPRDIQSSKLYMITYGADTQDVSDAFDAGCFLAVFIGHCMNYEEWTNGPLFTVSDLENLSNEGMYPFVVNFTCGAGQFHRASYDPGWMERWLRIPDKGAVAAYGLSMTMTPYGWAPANNLYKFLFQSIYIDGNRELSPACQSAMAHLIAFYGPDEPVCRDWSEGFSLQGDPTLGLVEPPPKNYLIVVPEGYAGTAPMTQFAGAKEAQGFNVLTYSVPSGTSREAIRSYIQSLWGTPDAPDYLLIVGDTSGSTSTSTTIPHWVGGGTRAATTDLPYACMGVGDDWYPDLALGRFSVSSQTELQTVVDKTLLVESGVFSDPDYVKRAAFLATNDSLAQAEDTHDWVISTYLAPAGYDCTKIYAAQGGGTQDIADAVNDGSLFAVYMGHSTSSGWWAPAFDQSDIADLTNAGLYGLVMGWSCNTSHFDLPECFGETWIRKQNAGAAAYLSASDYIWWSSVGDWESSRRMEKYFFQSVFEDGIWRVGPAWQAACYRLLDDPDFGPTHDHTRNIFEEFVLLGDPALRLPQPVSFSLNASPDSQNLCCPPDDQAFYNIVVGQTGGFSEQVTLQAIGQPPGATVDFDANSQQPPFASIMTIGNLAAAPAGEYDIEITGTTTSGQRSVEVGLHVADDVPGSATLVSPPDDAVNVSRAPTLTWQASAGAAEYDLKLATDAGFANIVYSATVYDTSHQVGIYLDSLTEYFWVVRAVNGCGNSAYSSVFSFTTLQQADYFTEQFGGGVDSFDLDNLTIAFIPDGSASFYRMCSWPASRLPTNPAGGTELSISEDSWATVALGGGAKVRLYGVEYDSFYVCDNGSITFTQGDNTWQETLDIHFSIPRIAPLFDDFSVANGGVVSWKSVLGCVVVTYEKVPEYNTSNRNTFQVETFVNGEIHVTWLGVEATDGIVGLSAGQGVPGDFLEMDLSAAEPCAEDGACCVGETCAVVSEDTCTAQSGVFQGDGTDCDPNPCLEYESACVIITEVVDGCLSGGCPKWIEIVNTGLSDFAFIEGGLIVQMDSSSDVVVDVDLSGVTIPAGESYVINSNHDGVCTGAFPAIYGFDADLDTAAPFGDGDDRYILTDEADGSNLLDIYGEFGTAGGVWEYGDGYSYRLSAYNSGCGQDFAAQEWFFGGVGSLDGEFPEQLLLDHTTPDAHSYDESCDPDWVPGDADGDRDVDLADYLFLFDCMAGPEATPNPKKTTVQACLDAFDLNFDDDVDLEDFWGFQTLFGGTY